MSQEAFTQSTFLYHSITISFLKICRSLPAVKLSRFVRAFVIALSLAAGIPQLSPAKPELLTQGSALHYCFAALLLLLGLLPPEARTPVLAHQEKLLLLFVKPLNSNCYG
jgi:hypothetical protein